MSNLVATPATYADTVVLTTLLASTPEIVLPSGKWDGIIHVPSGSSITSLTFYVASSEAGTYVPLYTTAGAAVSQTVAAARAYPVKDEVKKSRFVKIVADAAGSIVLAYSLQ